MIKASDFLNEEIALKVLVDDFAGKMRTKVLKKLAEGYSGWDDPDYISYMYRQLDEHMKKCDWIDVADIAMFLSNFDFSCVTQTLEEKGGE